MVTLTDRVRIVRDDIVWTWEQRHHLQTRYGWKSWDYIIDTREAFGHAGRYPRPVAEFISAILREFTKRDFGTVSRKQYLRELSYWSGKAA